MRPTAYIPNYNGCEHLPALLGSLRAQTREVEVVIADNGSSDGSVELVRERFPEVTLIENGENLGFGPALNRAIEAHPGERGDGGDPIIVLNTDLVCDPQLIASLVERAGSTGAEMIAAVLLSEADPTKIDSAGVICDRTLMGFDYLHGTERSAAASVPAPLGPTGGAALYSRAAFEAVGGFDERIFLYYEDLDLALRLRQAGARCELSPESVAIHGYSKSIGAATAAKYERTGWSRGYMLRRYGVMRSPRAALRVLAAEGAICAGQALADRTFAGLRGRIRGYRDARGLRRRQAPDQGPLDLSLREALSLRRGRRGWSSRLP